MHCLVQLNRCDVMSHLSNMTKVQVRNKVKRITDNATLDALFDTDAEVDV